MLFNSYPFIIFLLVVYGFYVVLKHRAQNWLLIVASCLFYASWNWKFLFLMFASISTDFWCSQRIARTENIIKRRFFLILSISVNLGILGFFKYYNFFIENLHDLLCAIGFSQNSSRWTLNIILPLGISFYTFEAISYVVDVYRRLIKPADRYWDYVLFVIYFPHLIAGPIMRAKDFIPQVANPRRITLNNFYEGCFLFFWGLFEKIFIADNLAKYVDPVFSLNGPYDGSRVMLALYAFAFQILCDFDGYSNMARGIGKCMGFEISINFKQPYFTSNPRDFWQRWHITLSSWLRDYVYIPLGGNRHGSARTYINLFLTMLIGGFWHGASWTFIIWGMYQGGLLMIHRASEPYFLKMKISWPKSIAMIWKVIKIIFFFHLICLGWLFFRAKSITQAWDMLQSIVHVISWQAWKVPQEFTLAAVSMAMAVFVGVFQFKTNDLAVILKWPWWVRSAFYVLCYILVIFYGAEGGKQFIYFQF